MRSVTVASAVIGVYAVVASFAFATTAVETMLLYPNIFRDVPQSLAQTEEFMSVVAVGDVMRPMGGVLTLTALIACAVAVRYRLARGWMVASLVSLISGQFLLSVLYQWPRASILFDDRDQHTVAEIEQAATEFLVGQGFRILAAGVTAACAVVAALLCYRARVLATAADDIVAAL
ncbi:hypothetical protein IU438_23430 [Nocardia cyriacigeorgica]|uniref:hypothetical protein n=1 Tax=Nocardia cyriacigeorgica TaxID=135487 RepID=UPI001892DA39|nr:hypothetical protein [Nocardia cyriacigeorgica]MBF6398741.1 hypothetical protein [Nocardia cyriacigeorgica]MBF6403745.1 hypothetical protein [Nocardia cyriacigeorgica]